MTFNLLNQLRHRSELRLRALVLNEGTLADKLRAVGIDTHVIPEASVSFAKLCLTAYQLWRDEPINIIHSHRYKENLLALWLARSLGVRSLVSTLHGLPERSVRTHRRTHLKARADYFFLRSFFDRVVAVSWEMQRTLVAVHGFRASRVAVIHNGVPLPGAAPQSASGPLHIGTVGRLEPVKRFDLFLAVAACLRAQADAVRFSILGDGPLLAELRNKSKALQLEDCVDLRCGSPDPLPYYQSLDIYLNTSLHEGLPLSVLEAMACATPVVASRVGGIPEIVSHGMQGLLVESSEPEDFARSCMQLVTDRRLRTAMGHRAKRRVAAHFRDTRMADAYRQLYLEVSEGKAYVPGSTRRRLMSAPEVL